MPDQEYVDMWAPVLERLEAAPGGGNRPRREEMQELDPEYRPGPFTPADLSLPASPTLNRWAHYVLRLEVKLPMSRPDDPDVVAPLSEDAYQEYRRQRKRGTPWKGAEGDDEAGLSDALSLKDGWESDVRPLPSGTHWRRAGWEQRRPPTTEEVEAEMLVGSDRDAAGETDDEMEMNEPGVPVPPSPPPVAPSPPPPAVEQPPPPPLVPVLPAPPAAPSVAQYIVIPPIAPPPPGRIEAPELPYRRLASVPVWMAGEPQANPPPWREPHRF